MAGSWFPRNEGQRLIWIQNFLTKLPGYQVALNISTAELDAITDDLIAYTYAVNIALQFKAKAQDVSAYKNNLLTGSGPSGPFPTNTPLPTPPTVVEFGVEDRLTAIVNRIVSAANYTTAIGEDLGIVSPSGPSDPVTPKPTIQARAMPNSQVEVKWVKGEFTGVIVECQRGNETTWTVLAQDFFSPYIDTRAPLIAGQPELRRYRVRYLDGDEAVGDYSDVVIVTTMP